jgi:hypothetical protein
MDTSGGLCATDHWDGWVLVLGSHSPVDKLVISTTDVLLVSLMLAVLISGERIRSAIADQKKTTPGRLEKKWVLLSFDPCEK